VLADSLNRWTNVLCVTSRHSLRRSALYNECPSTLWLMCCKLTSTEFWRSHSRWL
jgi:hypothetical protein